MAALLLAAGALPGQQPRGVSLDVTLGGGAGLGGVEVYARGGVAGDALLGVQLGQAARRAFMAGIGVGFQGLPYGNDICHVGSRGQCLSDFPAFGTVGLLAGLELRSRSGASPGATLRVLSGPAYVHLDGDDSAGQRGNTAGVQGRVDVATPPLGPLAAVLSLRGTLVPRFRDQTLATWALGVGLRLR
jgi:hypothetical protein